MPAGEHCMHDNWNGAPLQRSCCWCGMLQHQVIEPDPAHGPFIPRQQMRYHWEPSSNVSCPNRQVVAHASR